MLGMIAGNAFSRRVARHRLRGPDQLTKTFKLRVTRRLLRRANGRRLVGLRFVAVRLVALRLVVVRLVAFRLVAPRFVTLRFVALRVVALRFVGLRLDALRFVAVRLVVLRLGIGLELLEGVARVHIYTGHLGTRCWRSDVLPNCESRSAFRFGGQDLLRP
jgi:hypothetical protein